MKYIVYQTLNLVNNKIYIGVHKTEDPTIFDGYFGCGISLHSPWYKDHPGSPFQYALHKYGFANFRRTTLKIFDSLQEALDFEAEIVDLDFTKRNDTYNIAIGGGYGKVYFPIYQFDRTGKLIKKWDNQHVAAEALGTHQPCITKAIKNKGSHRGYLWSKDSVIDINDFSWNVGNPVYQYDMNGDMINVYDTIVVASKKTGCTTPAISRAIRMQCSHRGFYWSFVMCDKFVPKQLSVEGKTLYIYDLDGNFLAELKTGKDIAKYYNRKTGGSTRYNIKEAIMNGRPFKNTQISLEKVERMTPFKYDDIYMSHRKRRVGRFSEEGNLLEEFDSIKQAIRKFGSGVGLVLHHKQRKTRGYVFRFID